MALSPPIVPPISITQAATTLANHSSPGHHDSTILCQANGTTAVTDGMMNACSLGCNLSSPPPITVLSHSPRRTGVAWLEGTEDKRSKILRASPVQDLAEEEGHLSTPSSPLLTAMREAVESINQYDDFDILEKIGTGFFAEVFRVRHIPTDRIMVLKLNRKMSGIKKLKEVELLKKLRHPNILRYYGACVHNGQLHPLTEYMNGGTLEGLIQSKTIFLPMSLRLKLSLDIALGMEYLHSHGMLHRDLNSKNCLLRKHEGSSSYKYTAVVADFGLAARAPHLVRSMQRSQSVVGTPFSMAPEVINGKQYDGKADVFSFGIILCELISRLETDPDKLPRANDFSVDSEKFRNLPSVQESKPCEELMAITACCCQFLPEKRPDFSELKTKLEYLLYCYESDLSKLYTEFNFPSQHLLRRLSKETTI